MQKQDFEIPLNVRVSLKDEVADELYTHAYAGSEGWIRSRRHDNVGFPMVFVEWDKDHWAYNGQGDTWTFEDHFNIVEEDMSDEDKVSREDLAKAFAPLAALVGLNPNQEKDDDQGDEVGPSPELAEPAQDPAVEEKYNQRLDAAKEAAENGEAFLVISIGMEGPEGSNERPFMVPRVFTASKDDKAMLLLESQLSPLAAEAHQALAISEIRRRVEED